MSSTTVLLVDKTRNACAVTTLLAEALGSAVRGDATSLSLLCWGNDAPGLHQLSPVHRLDHRTSGALLFPSDSRTAGRLHAGLKQADTEKLYNAILRGNWYHHFPNSNSTTVHRPINADGGTWKHAQTTFQCLAIQQQQEDDMTLACSLVVVHPETGRPHQIRRHAFHMGMPVLGDGQHGDSRVNRWWRTHRKLKRMMLHCFCLDFSWERGDDSSDRIHIVAPLPNEIREFLMQAEMGNLWDTAIHKEPRLAAPFVDIRSGTLGIQKDWQKKKCQEVD